MFQIDVLNEYLFLTSKPVIYLVNLSEKDYVRKKNKWSVPFTIYFSFFNSLHHFDCHCKICNLALRINVLFLVVTENLGDFGNFRRSVYFAIPIHFNVVNITQLHIINLRSLFFSCQGCQRSFNSPPKRGFFWGK